MRTHAPQTTPDQEHLLKTAVRLSREVRDLERTARTAEDRFRLEHVLRPRLKETNAMLDAMPAYPGEQTTFEGIGA